MFQAASESNQTQIPPGNWSGLSFSSDTLIEVCSEVAYGLPR